MFQWMYKYGPNGFWYKLGRAWDLSRLWARKRKVGGAILAAFLLIAGLWATSLYLSVLSSAYGWPQKIEGMGQVGDSFGLVNSLFTGLTLFFLLYTIHLQRREIAENRRAIAETSRDQYIAARLNAAAAMLEAYDRDAQAANAGGKAMGRFVAWERARLRQVLNLLECEAKIRVGGRWTPEQEVLALTMLLRNIFLRCGHERHRTVSAFRSKAGAGEVKPLSELRNQLLSLYAEWQAVFLGQIQLLHFHDNMTVMAEVYPLLDLAGEFGSAVEEFRGGECPERLEDFDQEPVARYLSKTLNKFLIESHLMALNLRFPDDAEL